MGAAALENVAYESVGLRLDLCAVAGHYSSSTLSCLGEKEMNPKDEIALSKVPMWSLPAIGAVHGAMATGDGIRKGYGSYNWRYKPISMMEHIGALERHIAALKDGEDFTRDSNITHLGCVIAGASIILDAAQCNTLIDDRPTPGLHTVSDELEDYRDRPKTATS